MKNTKTSVIRTVYFVIAFVLVFAFAIQATAQYDLMTSSSPDRWGAVFLDGQTCSGNIYVFTGPADDVKRVTFYLDGVKHRVENFPPYDFEGTADSGDANSCDTTQFIEGEHEIKALVELTSSITKEVTAVFTVTSGENLWLSTMSDRSDAVLLDGQTVSGNLCVFASPPPDHPDGSYWNDVFFYLDGVEHRFEFDAGFPPYDFEGTDGNGLANLWDTTTISNGEHKITVDFIAYGWWGEHGEIQAVRYTASAVFRVDNFDYGPYLWMSKSPNRSGAVLLHAMTVSGDICVFTSTDDDDVQRVTFFLDGVEHQVENWPPYDFDSTENDGSAKLTDTTLLTNGEHQITADRELCAGFEGHSWCWEQRTRAVFTVDNEGTTSEYDLWMSTSPNRSNPVALNSQNVSDNIYVFTGPDDNVKRVTFYIDGVKRRVENYAAYDLEGTAGNGLSNPCDTNLLDEGDHEVRAVVELTTGGTEEVTAVFTVNN